MYNCHMYHKTQCHCIHNVLYQMYIHVYVYVNAEENVVVQVVPVQSGGGRKSEDMKEGGGGGEEDEPPKKKAKVMLLQVKRKGEYNNITVMLLYIVYVVDREYCILEILLNLVCTV